jgi:signal transduction histidine kinase
VTRDIFAITSVLGVALLLAGVALGLLYRRLRAAEEALRAHDELIAVAAHELKTPLTIITGYAQALQRRAMRQSSLPQSEHDKLRVIIGQARRLDRLIDSLLDLSSLQHGQFRLEAGEVDLSALARRAADDVGQAAPRYSITAESPETPLLVHGDALRLEQVLWNLLQNAIKYSPAGGPIQMQVRRHGQEAWLSVRDHGIGIPEEEQGQLFQPFYRADTQSAQGVRGVGIGLAVVHDIVRRHGGAVEVASVEGQGSTFTVRLPLAAPAPGAALPESPPLAREAVLAKAGHEEHSS